MRISASCLLMALLTGCAASEKAPTPVTPPKTAPLEALFLPPSPDAIPGDRRGESIRLGYEIVVRTQDYAKPYVGNALNCTHCHLDAGLNPNAASFVGLSRLYPEYRARADRRMTLADRINECFERSLNGKALLPDSSKLEAIVSYIDWLSQNVPHDSLVPWRGIPRIASTRPPDAMKGKKVYAAKCALCHGSDGQGTIAAPPVWGPQSYNIAAGMARTSVAASFIKANMPRGWGWSVTDDEAFDVAAYINQQPRPDFESKKDDWPKGGKPADAPY